MGGPELKEAFFEAQQIPVSRRKPPRLPDAQVKQFPKGLPSITAYHANPLGSRCSTLLGNVHSFCCGKRDSVHCWQQLWLVTRRLSIRHCQLLASLTTPRPHEEHHTCCRHCCHTPPPPCSSVEARPEQWLPGWATATAMALLSTGCSWPGATCPSSRQQQSGHTAVHL